MLFFPIIKELIEKYPLACRCPTLLQLYTVLWEKVAEKIMEIMFLLLYFLAIPFIIDATLNS